MANVVTIYSTVLRTNYKVVHRCKKWGGLKKKLKLEGYPMSTTLAIAAIPYTSVNEEGELIAGTKSMEFSDSKALLPKGDFDLHLYPLETKKSLITKT